MSDVIREPHIHTPAHDPVRRAPPIRDIGSGEWWRDFYQRQGRPKPEWWDRMFGTPWEKADG